MKKPLFSLLAILTLSLSLSACAPNFADFTPPTSTPSTAPASPTPTPITTYEFTATTDNQSALELLESSAKIETKDYGDAGKFVTTINGTAADSGHYWAFYLNGKYAEKGISLTTLQKGDTIKFIYEAVAPTP